MPPRGLRFGIVGLPGRRGILVRGLDSSSSGGATRLGGWPWSSTRLLPRPSPPPCKPGCRPAACGRP